MQEFDSRAAMAEGWGVFWSDQRGWEIQRDDEAALFSGDDEALEFVERRASQGSAYHASALEFIKQEP